MVAKAGSDAGSAIPAAMPAAATVRTPAIAICGWQIVPR